MDGLTTEGGAVRRNGRVEEEKIEMDITFINFLPFSLQRKNLFLPYTSLRLLWSLSFFIIIITTTNKKA